jgi:glycerol-3-phosphate cytidylyltransferase
MITGFTCSTFDLFHAGHVMMLEEAKSNCDYLIVGLQTNPNIDRPEKNSPIQTLPERFVQIKACKYVDEVIPYQTENELELLLWMLPIQIRILGAEYRTKNFTGKDICEKRGIELYFNSREHNLSTSNLRKRVFRAEQLKFSREELQK